MADRLMHHAMDLKDVAATHRGDPFEAHLKATDQEEAWAVAGALESEFESPHPTHERIDKLLTVQDSLAKAAHAECTPEESMWRAELNEAVQELAGAK